MKKQPSHCPFTGPAESPGVKPEENVKSCHTIRPGFFRIVATAKSHIIRIRPVFLSLPVQKTAMDDFSTIFVRRLIVDGSLPLLFVEEH